MQQLPIAIHVTNQDQKNAVRGALAAMGYKLNPIERYSAEYQYVFLNSYNLIGCCTKWRAEDGGLEIITYQELIGEEDVA